MTKNICVYCASGSVLGKKYFDCAKELGENMSDEELKDMLERASKNGVELTFEEFYDIMTKKSFP